MYEKAFRLEGYVVCFVSAYTAWFPVVIRRVVVTDSSPVDERLGTSQLWSSFAFVCKHYIYISIYH